MGRGPPIGDAAAALRGWRAARRPGAARAARGARDIALVGGAVRDLLLGAAARARRDRRRRLGRAGGGAGGRELAGRAAGRGRSADAPRALRDRLGGRGAAGASTSPSARAESYPAPGALPRGAPGKRRGGPRAARLHRQRDRAAARRPAPGRAAGGRRRAARTCAPDVCGCCTSGASPRTLPGCCASARYARAAGVRGRAGDARAGRAALAAGALGTVSGVRIAAELLLVAEEADARGFAALGASACSRRSACRPASTRSCTSGRAPMLPADGRRELRDWRVLFHAPGGRRPGGAREAARQLMDELRIPRRDARARARERLRDAAAGRASSARAAALASCARCWPAFPRRRVAIAGALAERRSPARRAGGRGVARRAAPRAPGDRRRRPAGGAGVPRAGDRRAPACALAMRLDGQLDAGREAELRAALEAEP